MKPFKDPFKFNQILSAYKSGLSASRICRLFGLSESRYYELVRNNSIHFESAKKMRLMAQTKKQKMLKELHQGPKVKDKPSPIKITPDEKVAHLERRLEIEKKKNEELEKLLKLAKEQLGKL